VTDFAVDYREVFDAIMGAVEGKSISANGQTVAVPTGFFNRQPELRNDRDEPSYPTLTVRLFTGVESALQVNEPVAQRLTVAAAAPYLEGVKTASLALADGQTFVLRRHWRVNGVAFSETVTVLFSSGSFGNIAAATTLELATVLGSQLPSVKVTLRPGNIVRLEHYTPDAGSVLEIVGGTATALIDTFPDYRVIGRSAGEQLRRVNPPIFYDFLFHVVHKTNREDHYALVSRLVERLFLLPASPNQRAITVATNPHAVDRAPPIDDHVPEEGVFITTVPFTLKMVPVVLDEAFGVGDIYSGGSYNGTGQQPFRQAPLEVTLVLEVEALDVEDE
jgi:hypothetical protein